MDRVRAELICWGVWGIGVLHFGRLQSVCANNCVLEGVQSENDKVSTMSNDAMAHHVMHLGNRSGAPEHAGACPNPGPATQRL